MELNSEEILKKILTLANFLEFLEENRFKIISYRRAVRSIQESGKDVMELYRSGELKKIAGVGDAIFKKIAEIIETGNLRKLDEVRKNIPENISEMLEKLPVSGKKVRCLVNNGIDSIDKLRDAVSSGRLEEIPDFGKKSAEKIKNFFS